jgi:hypothetical protein
VLTLFAFMGQSGQIYLFVEQCVSADVYFRCICPTQKSSSFTESPGPRRRYRLIHSTHTTNPKRPVTFHRLFLSSLDTVLSLRFRKCVPRTIPVSLSHTRLYDVILQSTRTCTVHAYCLCLKLLHDVEVSNVT